MFPARLNEEKKSGGEKTTAPSLLFLSSLRVAFSHVVVVVELSRYRFRISELRCEGKLERIHFFFSFRSRTKRRFQRRSRISIIMREALSSSLSSRALLPFIPRVSRGEKEKERAFHEHHPPGIFRTRLLRQQILLSARILYTEGIESKRIVYLEI